VNKDKGVGKRTLIESEKKFGLISEMKRNLHMGGFGFAYFLLQKAKNKEELRGGDE